MNPIPMERPPFAAWIEEHLGLDLLRTQQHDLGKVLEHRLRATQCTSFDAYCRRFQQRVRERRDELAILAQQITIGETYFFREHLQIDVLANVALPAICAARDPGTPIRILSVGCSSGEEPYSIAIAERELRNAGRVGFPLRIEGVDANPRAIERARRGRYSEWALRSTPEAIRTKYFQRDKGEYQLGDEVARSVRFEAVNLFDSCADLWRERSYDVIFCRNVLIYFSSRKVCAALDHFATALVPDGFLFLGHSESTRGYSERFALVDGGGTFYYRPIASSRPPRGSSRPWESGPPSSTRLSKPVSSSERVKEMDGSSRRVDELPRTARTSSRHLRTDSAGPSTSREGIGRVLELLRLERFGEALSVLDRVEAGGGGGSRPTVLLYRAAIATHQARLVEAGRLCRQLLVEAPQCFEAVYLLGVVVEHQGHFTEAQRYYEQALAIHSSFAMAQLNLADMAARAGRLERARALYRSVLESLPRTTDEEMILFGGGFSRQALIELCQARLGAGQVAR